MSKNVQEEQVERELELQEPTEYFFSNPASQPPDKPRRKIWFDEEGSLHVRNFSAYWIPELTITEVIHGTTYTVTGSYEGTENFVRKLERITSKKFIENQEESE